MYLGVLKFELDGDVLAGKDSWERIGKELCTGINARFKVVAKSYTNASHACLVGVVYLAAQESAVQQRFEEILTHSEKAGYGRVVNELSYIEHLDALESEE